MSKLPCEVVRDLIPSYIDELTSDVTKNLVEEHVADCAECHRVLDSMKNPEAEPVSEKEKEEIDFLKKTRKKNRKKICLAVTAAVLLVLVLAFVRNYLIGTKVPSEYMACQVGVNGKLLTVKGAIADEGLGISNIEFTEEDGVVTICFKSVKISPFFENNFEKTFTAEQDITEVRLGDRILWVKGKNISAITSAVYQTAHPYIGDASANGRTAGALNMAGIFGSYKNELQTTTEPYGWHFLLEQEFSDEKLSKMGQYMFSYACVLLAVVDNLGEVTYEFSADGQPAEATFTAKMATEFAGEDIKSVGKDIIKLQQLMEKAELIDMAYVIDYSQWNNEEKIDIELVNLVESELSSIILYGYVDEELRFSRIMSNADGSTLEKGTVAIFEILPEDFDSAWSGTEQLVFRIGIRNKNGEYRECEEHVKLPPELGYTYPYRLTGNEEGDYHISQ